MIHQLGYNPEEHPEGKGFILTDGSVWTWPTGEAVGQLPLRPQHMNYSYKVKKQGRKVKPGTAFAINNGKVWQFGEGRKLDDNDQALLQSVGLNAGEVPESAAASGYGHGGNLLAILQRA